MHAKFQASPYEQDKRYFFSEQAFAPDCWECATRINDAIDKIAEPERISAWAVSAFDNRGTYTHICVYDYTQMPSQLHTIACSSLGANSYLKQFLVKLLMLKSQA